MELSGQKFGSGYSRKYLSGSEAKGMEWETTEQTAG